MLLRNQQLTVDFGDEEALFTRFDRTGVVRQVQLADGLTFCLRENPPDGPGGVGLSNEFGLDGVIGYDEAKVGDCFLKPGVGWLRRDTDEPYNFGRRYPLLDAGRLVTDAGSDWARATWEIDERNGTACRLEKRVSLQGSSVITAYRMKNTGKKPFSITEYNHNFVSIAGGSFPGDYQLYLIDEDGCADDHSALMTGENGSGYCLYDRAHCRGVRGWALSRAQGSMSEVVDFPLWKLAVWTVSHVSCSELFYLIDLTPGAETSWTRTHSFSSSPFAARER